MSVVAIAVGACLLGSVFGWRVGLAVFLIGWGLREIK
jgi:hypothetical protein